MPDYAKYYIAIVPEGEIQEKATGLKLAVREKFNFKYALKSPAHVTLKMPFRYNEAKEQQLIGKLSTFLAEQPAFELELKGIGRFGRRVLYIRVSQPPELMTLQHELGGFCKRELKTIEELADKAYNPHMTVASKDVKDARFDECLAYLKETGFFERLNVDKVALLKKEDRNWEVVVQIVLGTKYHVPSISSD
ncbi:2'-5' RNA ligase family protein [Litoribacter ruber]|uniref:2'-5' RNA ligase family protein n=1 Tax=Litoribacter ruber TaxID=702568 RepID=UPI001BDA886D|nr:2'-5' RNA ligase family protein [Litoribacter ruber]MBT0812116.1 2'-5' RNA ligase family protein [Litoribacter ruber]